MFSAFGQLAATTQSSLYGKKHCTATGWEAASAKYPKPDIVESNTLDLSKKVYMVTGGNDGIGFECVRLLASKQASVYMVCRNAERAAKARATIVEQTHNDKVYTLIGDCGVEADIRRVWSEFVAHQQANSSVSKRDNISTTSKLLDSKYLASDIATTNSSSSSSSSSSSVSGSVQLDALICNAGALDMEKKITSEGLEQTFATHVLFGTYLLGSLALNQALQHTPESRLILVSSGGAYNAPLPSWEKLSATEEDSAYSGAMAYCYTKRAQVIIAEKWAKEFDSVKIVSCHPGWVDTKAVRATFGMSKVFIEPLRTFYQGAEGIVWLALAQPTQIEAGAFYLDREPQAKHMAGPLFKEGTYTKNTDDEIESLFAHLHTWSSSATRPTQIQLRERNTEKKVLTAMDRVMPLEKYMGKWFVLSILPNVLERNTENEMENYVWDAEHQHVDVTFQYQNAKDADDKKEYTNVKQRARINNAPVNTYWGIDPQLGVYFPLNLSYLIVEYDESEAGVYTIVSVPDRSYAWIMTRARPTVHREQRTNLMQLYNNECTQCNADDVAAWKREKTIVQKAANKCQELGIDATKLVRVAWNNLEIPPVPPLQPTTN